MNRSKIDPRCQISAPESCRFCSGQVLYVENQVIYGKNFGRWPYAYMCADCGAHVGVHPNTKIPLGTLADKATRDARKAAHSAFDPIWKSGAVRRSQAYRMLAEHLGIEAWACHIALFEVDQCKRVVEFSRQELSRRMGDLDDRMAYLQMHGQVKERRASAQRVD